ncbi:MAG: hypothetical protein JO107_04150 [Hyphomicrobiales bacterium]|nr:hypothetical protein [Hyphomicrobiales bacterium]MBV8662276.1 hypothetical protein [Hyphomicrobiales bacterium]
MTDTLEGVRGQDRRADTGYLRKLARRGQVSYSVVEAEPQPQPTVNGRPDNRGAGRRRTRLRSGKLLDQANKFLCDCLIHDRSTTGLRLALPRGAELPAQFRVHDDETGHIDPVALVWRRGAVVGVRFIADVGPVSVKPSDRAALRGRYYAVPD